MTLVNDVKKELLEGFYSEIEEFVLASMAAGVQISKMKIVGPEFKSKDYSIWLEGGIQYV